MSLKPYEIVVQGRLSFPSIFTAESMKNDPTSKARYGAAILIPKTDTKTIKAIGEQIRKLEAEKFAGKKLPAQDLPFHDGDLKDYDGYEGQMYLSANRSEKQGRPTVVDKDLTPLVAADNKPYAGCYCNFLVSFFVPAKYRKICCSLEKIQFVKDGEPFGGQSSAVDEAFAPVEGDDEDPDFG